MTNVDMANRQCCDLDIRGYKMKTSWLYADFYGTTIMGFSSEPIYVSKEGQECIKFDDPLDGAIAMIFQVYPLKMYAVLGSGEIETSAVITRKETTTCATTSSLTLADTPVAGTIFVYMEDDFGGKAIEGTVAGKIFTTTTDSRLAVSTPHVVGYLEKKGSDVKEIPFNNKKVPEDFYIQMSTLGKNEDGELVPAKITVYRAGPQRSLDLSFPPNDDPAEITITCNALVGDNGNVLGMIEISDGAE